MSQMTTSIFALPELVFPAASASSTTGRMRSAVPKLIVSDPTGKALNSWDLTLAKGTLGSAESCTICCPLPGIAPLHALLVSGARQAFVRALAGKLTRDGIPANELLLSDEKSYFEIAGFRFNLIRANARQIEEERKNVKRMQFAIARPLSISVVAEQTHQSSSEENRIDAPWVANVIRQAIEPLEAQIDGLLLPLAEFQSQSLQAQLASAKAEEEQRVRSASERLAREQQIVNMVAQQSATMEALNERITDVNQQLTTIERIIAKDSEANSSTHAETAKAIILQQAAIGQLQGGMISVSDSLKQLQERQQAAEQENSTWKNEVQQQLLQLTSAVTEFSKFAEGADQTALMDAIESLKQTHEDAQVEIGRWQSGMQQQLSQLQEALRDSEAKEQHFEMPAEIAEAFAEIQAKHDQSLLELQNWKNELKLEMQQLYQTASTASLLSDSINTPEDTGEVEFPVAIPQPLTESPLEARQTQLANKQTLQAYSSGEAEPASDCSMGTSQFIAQGMPSEFEEPIYPEVIGEDHVGQLPRDTWHLPEDSGSGQILSSHQTDWTSSTATDDNCWPTLLMDNQQVNSSHESLSTPFNDQWSAQPNADSLDNSSWQPGSSFFGNDQQSTAPSQDDTPLAPTKFDFDSMKLPVDPCQSSSLVDGLTASDWTGELLKPEAITAPGAPENSLHLQNGLENFSSQMLPTSETTTQASTASHPDSQVLSDWGSSLQSIAQDLHGQSTTDSFSKLPAWWAEMQKEETKQRSSEQSNNAALAVLTNRLYSEGTSENRLPQAASTGGQLSENLSIASQAPTHDDDDDQLVGLELSSSHHLTALRKSSLVSSIDHLAQQNDEENNIENLFARIPSQAEMSQRPSHLAESQSRQPMANPAGEAPPAEEESVEEYMKNLLARMRGEAVESPLAQTKPSQAAQQPAPTTLASGPAGSGSPEYEYDYSQADAVDKVNETADSTDLDSFVPLTSAPERGKNISVLRELANSSARTAIHRSTRRRTLSGSLMKLAICAISLTVAISLFAINGLAVNIALIATIAALFVALIWGYDGLKSLAPLLHKSLVLQHTDDEPASEE